MKQHHITHSSKLIGQYIISPCARAIILLGKDKKIKTAIVLKKNVNKVLIPCDEKPH